MRNLPPLSCLLAVLLLAGLIYFGYQVASVYLRYKSIETLQQEIYHGTNSPRASEIDADLQKVSQAQARYGGDELRSFKNELLLFKAWFKPDESVAALKEVLPVGMDLYRQGESWEEIGGWQVAWALSYACLPTRQERWADEVVIRAPHLRSRLISLKLDGKAAQDDAEGMRALIAEELKERGETLEGRVTALGGYVLLSEYEEAQKLAPRMEDIGMLDSNQLLTLAQLAVETEHFAQAREHIMQVRETLPEDPEIALLLAIAEAGSNGLESKQLPALLKQTAASTRFPRTEDGCRAWVYAELSRITGQPEWRLELSRLVAQTPRDFDVAAAWAFAAQYSADAEPGWAVQLAHDALVLARTPAQRQQAWLLLAKSQTDAALALKAGGTEQEAGLAEAARSLRCALGDPAEPQAVAAERVPDYTAFVLDESVQEARKLSPQFDNLVNRAVVDYLNRRIALFKDTPGLAPLEPLRYRDGSTNAPAPASEPAQSAPRMPQPEVIHKL